MGAAELTLFDPAGISPVPPDRISALHVALPDDIAEDTWVNEANRLMTYNRSHKWWIGDVITQGMAMFGPDILTRLRAEGVDPPEITECLKVTQFIPPDRRLHDLSWSHHLAVAKPELPDADRFEILARAHGEGLTVAETKQAVQMRLRAIADAAEPTLDDGDTALQRVHRIKITICVPESRKDEAFAALVHRFDDLETMFEASVEMEP